MTLRTRVVLSSSIAAFVGLFATTVQAQTFGLSAMRPEPSVAAIPSEPGRVLEGYYSHYRFDVPGDRIGMDGIGARVMWNPARTDYGTTALPSRFAVGLFGEYVPKQDERSFSLGHVGVQGDVNVFRTPLYGRVSPVASLGTGVLWTKRSGPAVRGSQFAIGDESVAMFALAPSVGTRVALWRDLGLRADARDLITFRDGTLHHMQLSAGLSFSF